MDELTVELSENMKKDYNRTATDKPTKKRDSYLEIMRQKFSLCKQVSLLPVQKFW